MTMTRQEQLDAVVRNYGAWKDGYDSAFWSEKYASCKGNGVVFVDSGYFDSMEVEGSALFRRAEVEQRKAELQNKPSWDDAPEGANILIQTDEGVWFFGTYHDAIIDSVYSDWNGIGSGKWMVKERVDGEVIGDWRDTLEKRPVADGQPTPEEEEAFKYMENAKLNSGETLEDSINNTVKAPDLDSEWDGEGLPPVGSDCFLLLGFDDFGKCKITYIGDGVFCYRHYKSDKEYTGSLNAAVFRPIKSDREKRVEAAMNGLSYAVDEHPEDMIGMIHDAMASGQLPVSRRSQMIYAQKHYWYLMVFQWPLENGGFAVASEYAGLSEGNVTKSAIDRAKKRAGVPENASVMNISFLGKMTREDFERG